MLRVPNLQIELTDIAEQSRNSWQDLVAKLSMIASGGGSTNKSFDESCHKLLAAALQDGENSVDKSITKSIDIRACTYQWLESKRFLGAHAVNSRTLQRFHEIKSKLGFQPLYSLIQLYFKKFEECGDLEALIEFLHFELEKAGKKDFIGELEKLNQNKEIVINIHGYKEVAQVADEQNRVLVNVMQEMGIDATNEGRFSRLANGYHYLTKLQKLSPEGDQSILQEVSQSVVTEMSYEGRLLGHFIIEALSNNVLRRNIDLPENWLQTILYIAGDPRILKASAGYQQWWAHISPDIIDLIHQSLGGLDLKLFLEVLDDFAQRSGDADLKRMFPKRRLFLEGLLKQKLIRGTRLFVSKQADHYLRRNHNSDELPNYARVVGTNTSIIYLKLDKAHIVEGSHNHRFWIYEDMPESAAPSNYSRHVFPRSHLSNMESENTPWHVCHNGFWQGKIIEKLNDMGIKVDPELVLDRQDYRNYRNKFDIQW
ncbi:MAG: EH signature domain-containing protein [Proteobacteria bacterium]|nr:EH signature domain-containing protein [Pseudomonadota bacterium]